MTVAATTRKAGPYAGNGAQTAFGFSFKVFQASDLYVVLADSNGAETVQTLTTNYTVSLNPNQDTSPGGTVTMFAAPPTGYTVTVGSAVPQAQGLQLANAGGFYPQAINDALDKLTIIAQQLAEKVSRAVTTTFSSTTSPDQLVNQLLTASSNAQSAAAAAAASAAAASKGVANQLTAVAGTNTITASCSTVSAYSSGQLYTFNPAATNTAAATLNVNGLGAVAIVKQGATAPAAGDLVANDGAQLLYDGTQFQLLNPATALSQAQLNARTGTEGTLSFRNRLRNGNFTVNQRAVSGTVTLAAGAYGHDGWKAGAGGCTYTFAASGADTIVTISAGSLLQIVEAPAVEGGSYTLSNKGTAQARIAVNGAATAGAYAACPITSAAATGGQTMTVEFTTGTLDRIQCEPGSVATTFERRPPAVERSLCRCYYRVISAAGFVGQAVTATQVLCMVEGVDPPMRAGPSGTLLKTSWSAGTFELNIGGVWVNNASASMTVNVSTPTSFSFILNGFSGLTGGQMASPNTNADALALSAEL